MDVEFAMELVASSAVAAGETERTRKAPAYAQTVKVPVHAYVRRVVVGGSANTISHLSSES